MTKVDGLSISIKNKKGTWSLVRDVSFSLERGRTLAIVGESGSGKSLITSAILGMLNHLEGLEGSVEVCGRDVLKASSRELRTLRRNLIGYIPQNPRESLTPTLKVGSQLVEVIAAKTDRKGRECRLVAESLLSSLGFSGPERILSMYPHQLSGGMCQRVAIAMAVVSRPALVVADEPTSSLDPLTKHKIMEVIKGIQAEQGFGLILVTHDLDLAFSSSDQVAVVYGGRLVETGAAEELLLRPGHPYTSDLVRCFTRSGAEKGGSYYIPGEPLSIYTSFPGCRYFNRCRQRLEICETKEPACVRRDRGRVACWLY
ncbi:MAG TPA: ABC transporter ATP-binding protein [Bacillota bacterium]|jgi:oligopeptide/dipeptide ABC transporter ATP-binding protein|nr:ABC transporter ATP-binding protein [Peptococcaceae bacterium MAG4]NLW38362.1 ABC transporter ATP-binding protein [Peptococcaceae bacterium]HPZ42967.1 ABC transporter ATP-binding protein [Bacillota bacterium]HQD75355.1 ABC transporter ATP-binding protein [Bacillota bacterium]HUM58142.1 ABC transporter ATP-binding protein [Bacillota bacterium]